MMAFLLGSRGGTAGAGSAAAEAWDGAPAFSMTEGPPGKYSFDGGQAEVVKAAGGGLSRKATAASRVGTAAQAAQGAAFNVIVIAENRAREVGISICNLRALHTIELVQLSDSHSYSQTLALMHVRSGERKLPVGATTNAAGPSEPYFATDPGPC